MYPYDDPFEPDPLDPLTDPLNEVPDLYYHPLNPIQPVQSDSYDYLDHYENSFVEANPIDGLPSDMLDMVENSIENQLPYPESFFTQEELMDKLEKNIEVTEIPPEPEGFEPEMPDEQIYVDEGHYDSPMAGLDDISPIREHTVLGGSFRGSGAGIRGNSGMIYCSLHERMVDESECDDCDDFEADEDENCVHDEG